LPLTVHAVTTRLNFFSCMSPCGGTWAPYTHVAASAQCSKCGTKRYCAGWLFLWSGLEAAADAERLHLTQSRTQLRTIIATQHFPLAGNVIVLRSVRRSMIGCSALWMRSQHRNRCAHSGRPALRRASTYFAGYSGRLDGPSTFLRVEIRSAGSISSNRAISFLASSSRPATAQLAAAARNAAWLSGTSRNAILAHDSASSYRPAKK
jgi:hypothetical protein